MALDILSYAMGKAAGGGSGGEADLIDATFTSNGTYSHGGHDGYDNVTVDVANSYTASDEGKVVSSGALVSQTSKNINTNGTHTTTTNNEVVVDVPNSYAAGDEGKVVSNGSLVAQTSTTKTANGTYDTTLNNEVVINVPTGITPTGTISITSNGITDVTNYASADVNVSASMPDNYETYVVDSQGRVVEYEIHSNSEYITTRSFGSRYTTNPSRDTLERVVLDEVNLGATDLFYNCQVLDDITLSNKVTDIPSSTFTTIPNLTSITLPSSIVTIGYNAFQYCYSLTDIYVPWAENAVANAPWGATSATIHYNSVV